MGHAEDRASRPPESITFLTFSPVIVQEIAPVIEIAVLSRNRGYLEIAVAYRSIETHDDPVNFQHVY